MCSDTECLGILTVSHIRSFFMPNHSGDMSYGDIETILSYSQSGEMYCDLSLGKFDF